MEPQWLTAAGAFMALTMTGVGVLKLSFSASHAIMRVPQALERSAVALERQAEVAEQNAKLYNIITELKADREEIGMALRVMSRKIEALSEN